MVDLRKLDEANRASLLRNTAALMDISGREWQRSLGGLRRQLEEEWAQLQRAKPILPKEDLRMRKQMEEDLRMLQRMNDKTKELINSFNVKRRVEENIRKWKEKRFFLPSWFPPK